MPTEVKSLTKEQAQNSLKEAKAEKGRLQKAIDQRVEQYLKEYNIPSWAIDSAKKYAAPYIAQYNEQIAKLDKKINELEETVKKYTGLTDVVRPLEKVINKDYAGATVDVLSQYATQYGNHKRDFFNVSYSKNFPTSVPGLSINAGFGASLSAALATKANANATSVTSTGNINCTATFNCGITLGYDIPVVGNCSLTGGVRGAVKLNGELKATLAGAGTVLSGSLSGGLGVNVGATLYLKTPSVLQSWPIECPSEYTYPLGTLNLLEGTMPTYSITFDMAKASFTNKGKSGEYSLKLHKDLEKKIAEAKQYIYDLAAKCDPRNWF